MSNEHTFQRIRANINCSICNGSGFVYTIVREYGRDCGNARFCKCVADKIKGKKEEVIVEHFDVDSM
jgi:hypothetical protein